MDTNLGTTRLAEERPFVAVNRSRSTGSTLRITATVSPTDRWRQQLSPPIKRKARLVWVAKTNTQSDRSLIRPLARPPAGQQPDTGAGDHRPPSVY